MKLLSIVLYSIELGDGPEDMYPKKYDYDVMINLDHIESIANGMSKNFENMYKIKMVSGATYIIDYETRNNIMGREYV